MFCPPFTWIHCSWKSFGPAIPEFRTEGNHFSSWAACDHWHKMFCFLWSVSCFFICSILLCVRFRTKSARISCVYMVQLLCFYCWTISSTLILIASLNENFIQKQLKNYLDYFFTLGQCFLVIILPFIFLYTPNTLPFSISVCILSCIGVRRKQLNFHISS